MLPSARCLEIPDTFLVGPVHAGPRAGARGGLPRNPPTSPRGGLALERVERLPERIDRDVVQERGELLLLPLPCGLPYAVQRLGHTFPALCPEWCFAAPRFPWSPAFAPPAPPPSMSSLARPTCSFRNALAGRHCHRIAHSVTDRRIAAAWPHRRSEAPSGEPRRACLAGLRLSIEERAEIEHRLSTGAARGRTFRQIILSRRRTCRASKRAPRVAKGAAISHEATVADTDTLYIWV